MDWPGSVLERHDVRVDYIVLIYRGNGLAEQQIYTNQQPVYLDVYSALALARGGDDENP